MFKDAENIAEDSVLIYECRHGRPESFRKLVEKYQDYIFDLCYRMTGSRQDAEDITQEAFVKFYNKMDEYNATHKLSNWLYTIALNDCRKKLRHDRIFKFFSVDHTGGADADDPSIELVDKGLSAEDHLHQKENSLLAQKLVMSLPDPLRPSFLMRYLKEMEFEEIAQVTGLTVNNVKVKIHRAKEYLINKYGKDLVAGVII